MKIYQVKVAAYCPAPREFVERIEATSYPVAIRRGVEKVLKEKLKGKRPHKVGVTAERL